MAMQIIRLYTGDDGESHFETTTMDMHAHGDVVTMSDLMDCHEVQFAETSSGGGYDWHTAPRRQFVITLSGTLEFENRTGDTQMIKPGDILLAEDTTGGGHKWRLVDDQPWRRCYVHLEPEAS
jgi:mannose-6-phosphate isomerase-like protein (cupin superfamily)